MAETKGTTVTLPKGSVIFQSGGAFEQGGTTARLAADAEIVFDRNLTEDELAAYFVAAGRQDFLQTLKGKFLPTGVRVENRLNAEIEELKGIDAPELARIERQKIEDDRLAKVQRQHDKADARMRKEQAEIDEKREAEGIRVAETVAEDTALAIDRDLRAKAAVADDETIKDDTERATDRVKFAEQSSGAVRGTEASLAPEDKVSPDALLNIPEEKKISPDHDTIAREVKAVETIGLDNAAVAKAHKTGQNVNEVAHKDGTNEPSVKEEISKEDAVKQVDKKTDLAFLPTDPLHINDKEVAQNEKEVEKGKKETDKESTDTKTAAKLLTDEKEQMDENKLVRGDEPATRRKSKTSEQVDVTKAKAAAKATETKETKVPVKK